MLTVQVKLITVPLFSSVAENNLTTYCSGARLSSLTQAHQVDTDVRCNVGREPAYAADCIYGYARGNSH